LASEAPGERLAQGGVPRHPRIVIVHTPKHASWLNQIEIYFSIIQRKVLTPNDCISLQALEDRIIEFGTQCPQCLGKTRQRKLPLVIHIDPLQLVALNKTCRYCPRCDLLIAHQDQLEAWLAAYFTERRPEIVGNDYLVRHRRSRRLAARR
jgi:hypothetical protein